MVNTLCVIAGFVENATMELKMNCLCHPFWMKKVAAMVLFYSVETM